MNEQLDKLAPGRTAKMNLVVDLLVLAAAIVAATLISRHPVRAFPRSAISFTFAATSIWFVVSSALRHYNPLPRRQPLDDGAMACVIVLAVATVLAAAKAARPSAELPELGCFVLLCGPTIVLLRLAIFRPLAAREGPLEDVLVLGTGPLGRATGEYLEKRGIQRVTGHLSLPDEEVERDRLHGRWLGMSDQLGACLAKYPISEVYLAGNPVRHADAVQEAIRTCEQSGVSFALPAYTYRLERSRPASRQHVPDGYVHYSCMAIKPHQMALKRLLDILASAMALWLLSPFLIIVAALVKLGSPGPVIYRQVRVGLHGRRFNFLKFRSMVANAESMRDRLESSNEQDGPVFKIRNDPRVTRVGRFLRKYSVDELPQLINVLRGDMSLVGPRPPIPSEVARYEPWQRRRLSVRPGLTCHWQVSGRNEISFEKWMYLDMRYIDHWSLREDVALILKTVPVVVSGRGAS